TAVPERGLLRNVDSPRGLAHGGSRRDDDELGGLETAGHAVEVFEVGGETGNFPLQLPDGVNGAEVFFDDSGDIGEVAGDAPLGDFEHCRLGGVQNFKGFFGLIGSLSDGLVTDMDELAEERLVLDDADVFFDGDTARQALSEG